MATFLEIWYQKFRAIVNGRDTDVVACHFNDGTEKIKQILWADVGVDSNRIESLCALLETFSVVISVEDVWSYYAEHYKDNELWDNR